MSSKIAAVRNYQKNCPVKLKWFVINILGYKCCESWSFEELVDEYGLGYMIHMDEELQKIRGGN
jgi:hypothetical protein